MTYQPLVECLGCKSLTHWLDLFPNQLCLNCHAIKTSDDTPEKLHYEIISFFGEKK